MNQSNQSSFTDSEQLDAALNDLHHGKAAWARLTPEDGVKVLQDIKDALAGAMDDWASQSAIARGLKPGSQLEGESWLAGIYAVMSTCNALIDTLSGMDGRSYLDPLPRRQTVTGQTAVRVVPHDIWDRLTIPGISAEVWMEDGVTPQTLAQTTAQSWSVPSEKREGRVALVLGAGNISSIPPLDALHKLFSEHQVVLLKLNPVNDYLASVYEAALKPLIDRDALRIVKGDGTAGAYLATHDKVDTIHITGSGATHDAIVWGTGHVGDANKRAGTPANPRPITSELGAVSPLIIVPGPWSAADLRFQSEHIATQKMQNSGFNCLSAQVLIYSSHWNRAAPLLEQVEHHIKALDRPAYYPGSKDRLEQYAAMGQRSRWIERRTADPALITEMTDDPEMEQFEVFGPALGLKALPETNAEAFLTAAIDYANARLAGTLSAGILIHPKTMKEIGKTRLEELVSMLRYGTVAVNAWSAAGYLLTRSTWGAFPGSTLENVGSGIGQVHNTFMFDRAERSVIYGPWRPFPRSILNGEWSLLPKPPWFITHRHNLESSRALTRFQYRRRWRNLPRIFWHSLRN